MNFVHRPSNASAPFGRCDRALRDFALRRHKAELVWCSFEIAVLGLNCDIISGCHDFSINIE